MSSRTDEETACRFFMGRLGAMPVPFSIRVSRQLSGHPMQTLKSALLVLPRPTRQLLLTC